MTEVFARKTDSDEVCSVLSLRWTLVVKRRETVVDAFTVSFVVVLPATVKSVSQPLSVSRLCFLFGPRSRFH